MRTADPEADREADPEAEPAQNSNKKTMMETLGDAATNIFTPTKKYSIVIPGTDQINLNKGEYKNLKQT